MSVAEIFAVTGKPVAHSLSPEIFKLLFREAGRDAVYTRLAAESAREALATAREIGIRGLNVTSPFKEEMAALVDGKHEHAARIGAVNCVRLANPGAARGKPDKTKTKLTIAAKKPGAFEERTEAGSGGGGAITGYNTDFIGIIGTLESLGRSTAGRAALVLGTGGAARAAAYGLIRAGAARVILAGRSPEKTEAAARSLGCDWARLADAGKILRDVDICVSCLPFPASQALRAPLRRGDMAVAAPDAGPPNGTLIIDAHYASAAGGAKAAAAPHGADSGNHNPSAAIRWLFHQAIPSYEIFTGLKVHGNTVSKIWGEFSGKQNPSRQMAGRHIALVGFMGAGKTTTGRELARLTGREFVDTDEMIEGITGMSIPEIFARRGESAFRSLESSVIGKLTPAGGRGKVIAVGGGAVLDAANRERLAENCRVVWLWAPVLTALSRIDVATRPVLDPGGPLGSAERTLAARLPLYASVSDLIVSSAGGSPLDVARRIKDEMGQAL
jgi:shikimate dehydrogenase